MSSEATLVNRYICQIISVLLVASACGSPADTADQKYAAGFLAGGQEFSDFRTAYEIYVHDLTAECMAAEGFSDWASANRLRLEATATGEEVSGRYFNIVDGLENADREIQEEASLEDIDGSLRGGGDDAFSKAESIALSGTGEEFGGCAADARKAADQKFAIDEINALAEDALISAIESSGASPYDEEVWLACMRNEGFGLTIPEDVDQMVEEQWRRDKESGRDAGAALRLERDLFLASEGCDEEMNVLTLGEASRLAAQSNPELVEAIAGARGR